MRRTTMRRAKASVFALCVCLCATGCVNNRYLAPASAFRDSTQKTITTISAFYDSRNSYELDLYLSGVAADPSQRVARTDASGKPTPLGKPVFSPASIKARLDALALVGTYATRLCELTNSKAPSDFNDAVTAMGKDVFTLSNKFQSLSGTSDPTAGNYVKPVATLIGAVGQMYLNRRRDQMARDAIRVGGPQVKVILAAIHDDMTSIFALELSTGGNEQLATLIVAYNQQDRSKLTYEDRMALLAQIKAAADAASTTAATAPAALVSAMSSANDALLKAANPSRGDKQTDFAALNTALNTWSSQIQTLASQIQPLLK